jgi:predicted outer membrane repeat protein
MGTSRNPSRRAGNQFRIGRTASHFHASPSNQRLLRIEVLEARQLLAITIDTPLDVVDSGDSLTSLREAIATANGAAGAETIEFAASLSGETISLTDGELEITDALTIDASSLGDNVVIDAQQMSRVLNFSAISGDLSLNGLTITGGNTTGDNFYPGNQTGYEPTYNGAGIRFLSAGVLTLTGSTVTANGTMGLGASGGGIASRAGDVNLINSTVSGNTTTGIWGRAGGVYAQSGTITVEGSTVTGNSTAASGGSGGGLFTLSGNILFNDSQLTNNHTMFIGPLDNGRFNNGGGISTLGGDVNITDSTVSGNSTAGDSSGGGAIIASDGTVTVSNSDFNNNFTAGGNSKGGAIAAGAGPAAPGAIVILSGSTFDGNQTLGGGSGGGALSTFNGTIGVTDSMLTGNSTASGGGGAIFNRVGLTSVTNSSLIDNYTTGIGSGGGALYTDSGSITLTDSTITGNYTEGDRSGGGAAHTRQGDGSIAVERTTFSNNRVTGLGPFDQGGAIYAGGAVDIILTSSSITGNWSEHGSGGGIRTREGDLTITDSTVSGNSSVTHGGGIDAAFYGDVTITGSTISGNSTTGPTVIGGGLYSRGGTVVIDQSTISGNRTTSDGSQTPGGTVPDSRGGGIALGTGSLTLLSSTVTDNHSEGVNSTGGGIRIINSTASVPATITNSIVAGNTGSSITFVPSPDLAYFSSPEQPILIESSLIGEIDAALLASLNTINSLIGTLGSPIDALIGPLANNGGPTQTHALLPGSPALMAGPIGTAAPFYDYRLDTFADSQGAGIDLTTLGGDGTLNGGVYEFGMNQGLETQILAANADDYSVELFFKFDNIDATTGYQKILEFGTDTHPDAGLYVFNNRLRYFVVGPIGFYTSSTNLSADTWYHLVLTRDNEADNPLRSYIDGQLQTNYTETFQGHTLGSFTAEGDSSATKVVQLFHSDTSFGQQQGGAVDQVRYYDHPLSSGEVADLFNVGPNTMVPDFDQRGLPRQAGTSIDIGAYEAQITPSADFDTDSDVDGADFLRWQRGFGTSNAMLVDGNSDDDMDTDASDLAAWEVSFGQPQTLAAFNSQP